MMIPDRWEYKFLTLTVDGDLHMPQHELNALGDAGWEVVALAVRGVRAEGASTVPHSRGEHAFPRDPMPGALGIPSQSSVPNRPVEYHQREDTTQYIALLKRRKE